MHERTGHEFCLRAGKEILADKCSQNNLTDISYRNVEPFCKVLGSLFHHHPVVIFKYGFQYKCKYIHPCLGCFYIPLAFYISPSVSYIKTPYTSTRKFSGGLPGKQFMLCPFCKQQVESQFITG